MTTLREFSIVKYMAMLIRLVLAILVNTAAAHNIYSVAVAQW